MTQRLSWASGPELNMGWRHSDEQFYAGMLLPSLGLSDEECPADHVGRIQDGLPWADGFFDYVVTHHGLMMLPEPDLVPALVELRRVTKSGGWLRVSVPDIERAIRALRLVDRSWFPVEAEGADEAFCRYVTQNGATRSVFTVRRLRRLLEAAGWSENLVVEFGYSPYAPEGITELDSRSDESIFMEAVKS